jgi:DNA gyrase/topoisomerase IV subunit A
VQRRILWALHRIDDGRFVKVANVVGQCMQFHPHGDASIYEALVVLANKRYLLEGRATSAIFSPVIPRRLPVTSSVG